MPSKAFDDSTAGEDEDRFQEITSDDDEDGEGKGGKDEESFQDAEEPVDEMKGEESSVGSKPPPSHVGGEGDSGVGTSGQGSKDKEETTEGEKEGDETVVWYDSMSTADAIFSAQNLKKEGNSHFSSSRYEFAVECYKEGITCLPPRPARTKKGKGKGRGVAKAEDGVDGKGKERLMEDDDDDDDDDDEGGSEAEAGESDNEVNDGEKVEDGEGKEEEEEDEVKDLRGILNANIGACYIKLQKWKEASEACSEALIDKPNYVKALHRRALASSKLSTWSSLEASLKDYQTLSSPALRPMLDPSMRRDVDRELARLPKAVEEAREGEMGEMMGKLKDLGNTFLGNFGLSTDNFKFEKQPSGGYSMSKLRPH